LLEGGIVPKKRVILELGSGNDLHGSDYTKAALLRCKTRCITARFPSFDR
jgi:hypothetical protein